MKDNASRRIRVPASVVASILLLVVPFLSFLHFHAYSTFTPGALVIASGLAASAAAVGWWMHRTKSTLLRVCLMAALLLVSVDLAADITGYHRLTVVVVLGATWILRNHIAEIASAMAIAYGAATLAFGEQEADEVRRTQTVEPAGDPPLLLHLIADEHIGVEGIPTDIEEGAALQEAITRFYVENGFRLYTRAYSRYFFTADALPNTLNFAASRLRQGWIGGVSASFPMPLRHNEYFERLVRLGYDLRVYQPTYLDLCVAEDAPASFCLTTPNNSLSHLAALDLNTLSSARYLAAFWITNESSLYSRIWDLYQGRVRPALVARPVAASRWNWTRSDLEIVGGLRLLQLILRDVESAPVLRGTAFFGHVQLPHSPYYLDERCAPNHAINLRAERRWLTDQRVTPEQRHALYREYLPQVGCWNRQLAELLAVLEARGERDAVVIVHGDHGSRIGTMPSVDSAVTKEQMADYHSTLFAIRAPGIAPGVDTAVAAIKDLLDRFSAAGFQHAATGPYPAPYVFQYPKAGHGLTRVRAP